MNNQKYNYVQPNEVEKSLEKGSIELTKILINEYRHYGFSYVFKKFMNPHRTFKEIDQFLMEFIYDGVMKPGIQSPSTYIVTGIDEIDFITFSSLMNKEASDKGFELNVSEGIFAVPISDKNIYIPQYITYTLTNGYKLIITTAGCDFNIKKYIEDETGK